MKKFLPIIIVAVMLLALAVPAAALVITEDVVDEATGETIPGGEVVVDNPYAKLYVEFFTDGNYPDDFAGVWVEGDGYVFALTEGADESKYEAVLGEYAGEYRFVRLKYSYNFLDSIKDDIEKELNKEVAVWGWGIYQMKNVIHYDAESADEAAYEALYRAIQTVAAARGIEIENDVAVLEESGPIVFDECEAVEEIVEHQDPGEPAGEPGIPMDELSSSTADEKRALEAYEAFCQRFCTVDENGGIVFPDDFTGAWYDSPRLLVLAFVNDTDLSGYKAEMQDHADIIVYANQYYSYEYMKSLKDDIAEALKEELEVYSWGISQTRNSIIYTAEEADYAALARAVQKVADERGIDIDRGIALIEKGSPIIPAAGGEDNPSTAVALAFLPAALAIVFAAISKNR